jgi:hypothetical protein
MMRFVLFSLLLCTLMAGCEGCSGSSKADAGLARIPQSTPSEPLLQQGNMVYQGAFRLPGGKYGAAQQNDSLAYGGTALAYNPTNNSLFMVGHDWEQLVAEISIPQIVNSTQLTSLNTARVLQGLYDITEGHRANIGAGGAAMSGTIKIGGLMVSGGRLIGTSYAYFDGNGEAKLSHFTSGLNLSTRGDFVGMFQVGSSAEGSLAGLVDGYMAQIPQQWQADFGGPALTGNAALSIISRTSYGPSAFVFDPAELGNKIPLPATAVVYYPQTHATLGDWGSTNPYFNGATQITGLVFPTGWRSVLFFGRHSTGTFCYGEGTGDSSLAATSGYCYDPAGSSKGTHAYPYVYQVWAYDALDLLSVKNGEKNPWDIKPYAVWQLNFPFGNANAIINGAAYDPDSQRIFISEAYGDNYGMPLIHVYRLQTKNK